MSERRRSPACAPRRQRSSTGRTGRTSGPRSMICCRPGTRSGTTSAGNPSLRGRKAASSSTRHSRKSCRGISRSCRRKTRTATGRRSSGESVGWREMCGMNWRQRRPWTFVTMRRRRRRRRQEQRWVLTGTLAKTNAWMPTTLTCSTRRLRPIWSDRPYDLPSCRRPCRRGRQLRVQLPT